MTGLLGPDGRPISSKTLQNKKTPPPKLGEQYGQWAGDAVQLLNLPGGGAIAFDVRNLSLADFRQMKTHYQINSSLSVLTFMMHQMEWHIESEDPKVAAFVEENLRDIWSRLVRAKSQALWAGYSPNVLQWENDTAGRRIVLNKVKDLLPEDCRVNWKTVEGSADGSGIRPQFQVYDGIKQFGSARNIPVENSYWYPLLMENGNYYGKRLLESAFQPWFFSTLMHLFANRYYERFGEPVPVGRAPYEDEIEVDGKIMKGNQLMGQLLQQIRSRSVVVLPNEKTQFGEETTLSPDYQIEYLESQMRGADFERYMTRLDEEMSLALFTPILMMRTADVGSYNLGTQHAQVYLWMLNAISSDWAHYINKYIIRPLRNYNFGPKAANAKISFVRMGKVKAELLQAILTELLKEGQVKFDARELGEMAGMTVEEVEEVTGEEQPPAEPEPEPERIPDAGNTSGLASEVRATGEEIAARIEQQVSKAFRNKSFGKDFKPSLGFRRRFEESLRAEGYSWPTTLTAEFYDRMDHWLTTTVALGLDEFKDATQFNRLFRRMLATEIDRILN